MDGTRFDALTKELARTPSRRRVVQTIGGGLAAGVLALVGLGPAEAGACRPPLSRCGKGKSAACVNTTSDPNNCGGCGIVCDATNGAATCSNGLCGITCNAGYGSCDGNAGNGCETYLESDNNNCGTCGNVCGTGTTCVNGACAQQTLPTCPAGSTCGQACTGSTSGHCQCGKDLDGNFACYDFWNVACGGHSCAGVADCTTDYGASSTCVSGFCTTPGNYCDANNPCASGYICMDLSGGCGGGCIDYTGSKGICSPICTS